MKKISILLVIICFLILGLAGCGGTGTAKSEKASFHASNPYEGDLSGVTLDIGAAGIQNAQGVLQAAGLDDTPYTVHFHNLRGGNLVLEAMAAGQLDAGCGSQIPPIFASLSNNGGNFKIVAIRKGSTLDQELITGPKSKASIHTVADLKGKKVAYVKSTTAQYFLFKMLEEAGLSWNDIEALPMSTSDGLSAVLTGDVDAYAGYGNSIIQAKNKGAVTLASAESILSGDYYWYAAPAALADSKKKAALIDYLERINEADEWIRQHPKEWTAFYAKETNQKADEYQKQFEAQEAQRRGRIAPLDEKTIQSEQDIINSFIKMGLLNQPVEAAGLFDDSLTEAISKFHVYE